MQTILITGGAGFIGHHVVKELISQNYKIIIIDNFSNSNENLQSSYGEMVLLWKVFMYTKRI